MTVSPIVYTFMFVSICCYSFGAYLHLRIIKVSRKDKELTWKLDVMNSVIILIMQFNNLSVKILTYGVTDLYLYTGEWFCYASKVIAFYSTTYVVGHSLIISILKYIMILGKSYIIPCHTSLKNPHSRYFIHSGFIQKLG